MGGRELFVGGKFFEVDHEREESGRSDGVIQIVESTCENIDEGGEGVGLERNLPECFPSFIDQMPNGFQYLVASFDEI